MNNDYNNQFNLQPQGPMPGQGQATGSLVCGIVSLVAGIVLGWTTFLALAGIVVGIVGVILAVNAKKQGYTGGIQTAGLVLSIIGAAISGIVFISCVACICISGAIYNSYDADALENAINDIIAGTA